MIKEIIVNNISPKSRIIVAPLDWGLGHATRCIPIIKELILLNCEVFIAAEGAIFSLLKKEFPHLIFLPVKGYRINYSGNKYFFSWKIFLQIPKIIFTIYKEHRWLHKIILHYKIDAVISDNRFGMYQKNIPCIFITHQLAIKTGNAFTERIAKKINYFFIKKYKECWIPDFKINCIAGTLSHPEKIPNNIQYIGCLSRFELYDVEKKYDLLILLSGPEPQRTIFEEKILNDLNFYSGKALLIRGLPGKSRELTSENTSVEIKNHLTAIQLNEVVLQSEIIISRCGYTTVMDLIKLRKKAILVPTPGQTEQEYLARFLSDNKLFYALNQKDFILEKVLQQFYLFPNNITAYNMEHYKSIITQFVQSL